MIPIRKSKRHIKGIHGSFRRDTGLATERYVQLDSRGRIIEPRSQQRSRGQALLIVALMMTVLVLFVGLGVDVGNLMGKRSKLQSAVDAAALSAAQLMSDPSVQSSLVVTKAYQMLETNGVPSSTLRMRQVTVNLTTFQVRVQAVQRVDTFFMRLIPLWRQVEVSADATADLNAYAEINTKPYGIPGVVNELNIAVWGPYSWRTGGDAYSPQYKDYPAVVNAPEHAQMPYGYLYRIDVPTDYPDNHLLVQLFDPDSYNRPDLPPTPVTPLPTPTPCNLLGTPGPTCPPIPTKVPTNTPFAEAAQFTWCQYIVADCSTGDARSNTGLKLGAYPVATVQGPPRPSFWRVDETRTLYSTCCGIGNQYADSLTTQTQYTLWHFDPHITSAFADPSTLSDLPGGAYIARYTGRLETTTDLAWVTPTGFDIKLNDPTDPSCNFNSNHDCYARETNRDMYFYLYVQSLDGSSENNFDIRVGPAVDNDACPPTAPCKVNYKYFDQMNDPTIPDWDTGRAFVFAKRALPLNLDTGSHFPMLFTQVSKNAAGQTLAIRHFDQDCTGGCGPLHTMDYQMQLCVNDGAGNYSSCADTLNDNCFADVGTGYVGPNNDWYCPNCPAPEKVAIPLEGTGGYTQFFGPAGQCPSSWLRLQSDPSYSQDTTVWEMPFARPRLIK